MKALPPASLNRRLLRWSLSEIRHGQLWLGDCCANLNHCLDFCINRARAAYGTSDCETRA